MAFWIFSRFSRVNPRVYDTNMLVSKMQMKTQEKYKKNASKIENASPMRENVSILQNDLGKNKSKLCFARVLLINLTKTQTQPIV